MSNESTAWYLRENKMAILRKTDKGMAKEIMDLLGLSNLCFIKSFLARSYIWLNQMLSFSSQHQNYPSWNAFSK